MIVQPQALQRPHAHASQWHCVIPTALTSTLAQGANQAAAAAKLQYPTYMLGQASPLVLPSDPGYLDYPCTLAVMHAPQTVDSWDVGVGST